MHDNDKTAGGAAVDLSKHDALAGAFPATNEGRLLFAIAFLFSIFQIATAAHLIDPPSQLVRAIHVGFVTVLIFPLLAAMADKGKARRAIAWGLSESSCGTLCSRVGRTADVLRSGSCGKLQPVAAAAIGGLRNGSHLRSPQSERRQYIARRSKSRHSGTHAQ